MTAMTVKRDARATTTSDRPREAGQNEAANFGKLLRQRRREAGMNADDTPFVDANPLPLPGAWMFVLAGAPQASPERTGATSSPTPALLQRAVEEPAVPPGVEVAARTGSPAGAEIRLRFTNGAWAGLEMQAALHAGEVVVKLRPANRLQHKRLTEAWASLTGQIRDETGEAVQLEIADATR